MWIVLTAVLANAAPAEVDADKAEVENNLEQVELTEEEQLAAIEAAIDADLNWQQGQIELLDGAVSFETGEDYRVLVGADADRVLVDLWGNPKNEQLALIMPTSMGLFEAWGVIVDFSDEGYVDDGDAADIDYAELLASIKEDAAAANSDRIAAGYPRRRAVGLGRAAAL